MISDSVELHVLVFFLFQVTLVMVALGAACATFVSRMYDVESRSMNRAGQVLSVTV